MKAIKFVSFAPADIRRSPGEIDAGENYFRVSAWRGDELNAQIVVSAGEQGANLFDIRASELVSGSGELNADCIEFVAVKEISAYSGRGGDWNNAALKERAADVLFKNLPVSIPPNKNLFIWVKIKIPRETEPGLYSGRLSFFCGISEAEESLFLSIKVLPLALPEKEESGRGFGLELWQYPFSAARYYGIDEKNFFGRRHIKIIEKHLQEYKKAGGDSISVTVSENPWNGQTYDSYPSLVKWIQEENGSFSFDYMDFDIYVSLCMKLGINKKIKSFSMLPWEDKITYFNVKRGREESVSLKPGSKKWSRLWGAFLKSYVAHLDETGWFDIAYISMDERPPEHIGAVIQLVSEFPNKEGRLLKIAAALNYSTEDEGLSALFDKIDDISVGLAHIEENSDSFRRFVEGRRQKGLETTIYTCVGHYPNSFTLSDPCESEWVLWFALSQGAAGFLRWAFDAWVEEPLIDVSYKFWESGDPFFIYPGNKNEELPSPRSSPRFEMLKQGMQNIEKARRLMSLNEETAARVQSLLNSLKRPQGSLNELGAMQAASEAEREKVHSEVVRMRSGIDEIALSLPETENPFLKDEEKASLLPKIIGIGAGALTFGIPTLAAVLKAHSKNRKRKKAPAKKRSETGS